MPSLARPPPSLASSPSERVSCGTRQADGPGERPWRSAPAPYRFVGLQVVVVARSLLAPGRRPGAFPPPAPENRHGSRTSERGAFRTAPQADTRTFSGNSTGSHPRHRVKYPYESQCEAH
jgi:hypothetical protein